MLNLDVSVTVVRLEFATQFELKEGRFLNAAAANTIKLKHYGTRVVEGWTRDVNGTEIPLKIKFNVFDVKSIAVDEQATKTRVLSLVGSTADSPEERLHRPERVADTDEKMCAPVEEIGDEARRATPTYVPGDPQTLSDELTKSTTCRADPGVNTA